MSDEAHLSAQQSGPQPPARLPVPNGDARRPQDSERAPCARSQEAQRLATLKKRADFLAANAGRRAATPGFVLLVRDRQDNDPQKRVGFTVTRKIGTASGRLRARLSRKRALPAPTM
jgi:ribonuclease P protein component